MGWDGMGWPGGCGCGCGWDGGMEGRVGWLAGEWGTGGGWTGMGMMEEEDGIAARQAGEGSGSYLSM